jgi:hypothetical protein
MSEMLRVAEVIGVFWLGIAITCGLWIVLHVAIRSVASLVTSLLKRTRA